MPLYRVKTRWSGFTGSPGYTVHHYDTPVDPTVEGATGVAERTQTFFSTIQQVLPSVVRLQVDSAVEIIDQTNSELLDVITIPAPGPLSGMVTGGFAASTGACITWTTAGVRNGRRVKGRSFIVPMAASTYETDGTLTATALGHLNNAAAVLTEAGWGFQVHTRETAIGANDGGAHTVTGHRISDKAAVLRSRRD